MSRLDALYERLPTPLQTAGVSAYGYLRRHQRLGGRFAEHRRGFAAREWYSAADWADWEVKRLREILELAWATPHYRSVLRDRDLKAESLSRLQREDLARLPVLDKDPVRRNPDAFCPGGRPGRGVRPYYTSGSTGTPITTYYSNDDFRRTFAQKDARYEAACGVTFRLPRATFSGRRVESRADSRGPFHRFNLAERQIYFSPYHLGPTTVGDYVEALRRHRPRWLTGYAGAIHELARLALEQGLECPQLDAVITAAEPVSDRLREDVAAAFGCAAVEEYGLIEGVCFGLECERGSLHISPDAGIVEILDTDDRPCPPGAVGEIVATGFLRESQILLRYRTGDLGAWAGAGCECGRGSPVLAGVEGRVDDVITGPDGRRVGRLSTVPKNLPGVVAMQFVQQRSDRVLARVVCDDQLRGDVEAEIVKRLSDRLGGAMQIEVAQVPELERTPKGKVRGVISHVGGP